MEVNYYSLYSRPTNSAIPQLLNMGNMTKLPVEGFSIPGSTSYYDPIRVRTALVRELTQNVEALFGEVNGHIGKMLNTLGSDLLIEQQSLTNQAVYGLNLKELTGYISDILKNTSLNDEEKKVLEEFKEAALTLPQLTEILPEAEKLNVSEDMIRFYISYMPHYFEWVNDWINTNNLLTRYSESKQRLLLAQGEKKSVLPQGVRHLGSMQIPLHKSFIGKVDKEPDEGNGLYITEVESVHPNGTASLEPIENKEVQLENLQELDWAFRSYGEIDIELPLSFISNTSDGKGKILPTHLGYKAQAILLQDADGKEIETNGITAYQDIFGITRIYDIPIEARTIKYRLVKAEPEQITELPDGWSEGISPEFKRKGDEIFNEAIERSSSLDGKLSLIATKLRRYPPIYTTDINIQRILSAAAKKGIYHEIQAAIGIFGKCDHVSITRANENNLAHIPSGIASGKILDEGPNGVQVRSDSEHAQTIYLDENRHPQTLEATSITSSGRKINERKVAEDTPRVLEMIATLKIEDLCKKLQEMSKSWRMKGVPPELGLIGANVKETRPSYSHFDSGYGSGYWDEDDSREVKVAQTYERAAKAQEAIDSLPGIKEKTNPYAILTWLETLTSEIDWSCVIEYDMDEGKLHIPIVRTQREQEKCKQDFINWFATEAKDDVRNKIIKWFLTLEPFHSNYSISEILLPFVSEQHIEACQEHKPGEDEEVNILPDGTVERSQTLHEDLHSVLSHQDMVSLSTSEAYKVLHFSYLVAKVKGLDFIEQNPQHAELRGYLKMIWVSHSSEEASPANFADYFNYCKLYGEDFLRQKLTEAILDYACISPEDLQKRLSGYYESGALANYLVRQGNKVTLTPEYKAKVEASLREGFAGNQSTGLRLGNFTTRPIKIINSLQAIGINIRSVISRQEAFELIKDNYPIIVHKQNGELDETKPVSLFLCYQGGIDKHMHMMHDMDGFMGKGRGLEGSKNAVALCNYFGISLGELPQMKVIEQELWETKLKTCFDFVAYDIVHNRQGLLTAEQFQRIQKAVLDKSPEMAAFIQYSGLCYEPSKDAMVRSLHAMCDHIPEAKQMIDSRLEDELSKLDIMTRYYSEQLIRTLINQNVSQSALYRFALVNKMFSELDEDTTRQLGTVAEMFFHKNQIDEKEFDLRIRNIFNSIPNTPCQKEIKAEVGLLNPTELRTFFALLLSDLQREHIPTDIFDGSKLRSLAGGEFETFKQIETYLQLGDLSMARGKIRSIVSEIMKKVLLGKPEDEFQAGVEAVTDAVIAQVQKDNLKTFGIDKQDMVFRKVKEYKAENYPQRGVGLIHRVTAKESQSFWHKVLIDTSTGKAPSDHPSEGEINMLSEQGEYFQAAYELSQDLGRSVELHRQSLFKNGQVQFISRSGPSALFAKSISGDFHSFKEAEGAVAERDLDQKASARTGKLIIQEKREPNEVTPFHYVVDLEWLAEGKEGDKIPTNIKKLMTILASGLTKKSRQHLHVFYRGEVLFSLLPEELRDMFSLKTVEDDFGIRNKRTDFILQLNFLANQTESIKDKEPTSYRTAPTPISHSEFTLPSRGGTAIIATNNSETLTASMSQFKHWLRNHFDVGVLRI